MAHSIEMPELGESVTEGTITTWLKEVGDTVEVDEPLLEVSTDKVDTEIPSPVAGVLLEIKADEDDTVEVGEVIAIVGDEGEEPAGGSDSGAEESAADEAEEVDSSNTDEVADDSSAQPNPADAPEKSNSGSSSNTKGSGESVDVEMPELGESVTEGTITTWLKSVGDMVEVDEPLLEVSTDKVDTEIPSPVEGTLLEILAEEDDTIEVGGVICRIGDAEAAASSDDSADESAADAAETESAAEPEITEEKPQPEVTEDSAEAAKSEDKPKANAAPASESSEKSSAKVNTGKVPYVTPLVRKLADKHGVELSTIEGTGVGGRIRKQDVLAAAEGTGASAEAASAEAAPRVDSSDPKSRWSTKSVDPEKAKLIGTTEKVNRIHEITAAKMVESLQITAQLTHVQEMDVTRIAALRKRVKPEFVDKHGVNITFLAFFVKAAAEALVSHPNVNASYDADSKEITYHSDVNIGIAVDTPMGLLVPVLKQVQDMNLADIAKGISDLAERARTKKLRPDDLSGATFTVSNIGSQGALLDTPILTPPQAGILGTAAIEKRPVVVSIDGADAIAIRQMCYVPLTYDHQLVDGADAGRFVTTIKDRIEAGDFEADLGL